MRDRPNDQHIKALAIQPGEVRDHINEDKQDNSPANLRAMNRGAHTRMHNKTRGLSRLRKALRIGQRKEPGVY